VIIEEEKEEDSPKSISKNIFDEFSTSSGDVGVGRLA